jgi:hypothetical protein
MNPEPIIFSVPDYYTGSWVATARPGTGDARRIPPLTRRSLLSRERAVRKVRRAWERREARIARAEERRRKESAHYQKHTERSN